MYTKWIITSYAEGLAEQALTFDSRELLWVIYRLQFEIVSGMEVCMWWAVSDTLAWTPMEHLVEDLAERWIHYANAEELGFQEEPV
jgi:hypothetical protein